MKKFKIKKETELHTKWKCACLAQMQFDCLCFDLKENFYLKKKKEK